MTLVILHYEIDTTRNDTFVRFIVEFIYIYKQIIKQCFA